MKRKVPLLTVVVLGVACNEPTYLSRGLSSWMYDLDSEMDHKRKDACEAVAAMGPPAAKAVPALIERLQDTNPGVQSFAQEALYKIGPASIPALEGALKIRDPDARFHAGAALVRIDAKHGAGGEALAKAATAVGNAALAERAQEVVIKLRADGVPLMLKFIDDPYAPVRLAVVKTLGRIGPKGKAAIPALVKKTDAKEPADIRVAAMQALAKIGTKEQVEPVLTGLLEDTYDEVADNAGSLLQYIGARETTTGYDIEAAEEQAKLAETDGAE